VDMNAAVIVLLLVAGISSEDTSPRRGRQSNFPARSPRDRTRPNATLGPAGHGTSRPPAPPTAKRPAHRQAGCDRRAH